MYLFIADIHIKLGQKNVPVEWAKQRYLEFFKQVYSIPASRIILGGDIFDRLPSMEELQLYFSFIKGLTVSTYIYSGNHESTKRGKSFMSFLKEATSQINPLVEIVDEILITEEYSIVPYEFIHTVDWAKLPERPVFTHVRGEIPPHVKPEIDLQLLDRFPIVYAGDLHSHSNSQRNIVYPGSPMTTSFHRSLVDTGYLLIDGTDWTWHKFELPQLIRKTVSDQKDMVSTDYHHTIYELEGDLVDLSNVKSNELLDKKLVKKSSDTALVLTKEMSVEDELVEYLLYILELPEDKVPELLGVYHDKIKKTDMG
jgi:DNA repair exonuclease SbcCD nuclease subunit